MLADHARLVARVRIHRQEAGQDLTGGGAGRDVGGGQREHGFAAAAGLQRQIVRRLQHGLALRLRAGGGRRIVRGLPEVLAGEELAGAGDVVAFQQLALHLEQALRVAHVAHQVAGDLGERVVLAGEDLLPGLDDRIVLVPDVQVHRAVVGVDGGLDRVADEVGLLRVQPLHGLRGFGGRVLGGRTQIRHLRVRVGVGGRVPVDDPLDAPVDHGRVDAAVERQVRGDLGDAFARAAVVQDLRFGRHAVGEQDLFGAEPHRVQQSGEDVADRGTAVAVEGVRGALVRTGRVIELPGFGALRRADDRILGGVRREVDTRLVLFRFGQRALRGDAVFEELGLAVGRDLVAVGGHDAVAVRVHGVVVDPVAVVEAAQVQLARGDDRVLADAVHVVLVHGERVGEGVVLARLLQLLEGRRDDLRVEQSDLRGRFGRRGQRARLALGGGVVLLDGDVVQAVRLLGGRDVALDIGRFHLLRVRVDTETLQDDRPDAGEQHGGDHDDGDGDHRHAPRLERRDGAHAERRATLQRVRGHQPDAEHHAQDGHQRGHDERDGDGGMHRCVVRAGEPVALRGQVGEHPHDHLRGEREHVEHQPDAELTAGALGDGEQTAAVDRHGDADAAHQHMGDDGEHDADQQHGGHGAHHQFQAGQDEDVEAVVQSELRVGGAEALRVEHEQDVGPVGVELRAERHTDHQRHDNRHHAGVLGADAVGDLDHVTVDAHRGAVGVRRTGVDGQRGRQEADRGHQQRVGHPYADAHAQLGPDHALEAELSVPHQVGDETGQSEEQSHDDGQRQDHADEDAAASAVAARPLGLARDARAGGPLRGRGAVGGVVAVGFHVQDHRVVIGACGVAATGVVVGVEHHAKRIEKRHVSSLAGGSEVRDQANCSPFRLWDRRIVRVPGCRFRRGYTAAME